MSAARPSLTHPPTATGSPGRGPAAARRLAVRGRAALLLVLALLAGLGLGITGPSSDSSPQAPARVAGSTIVEVEGDAANGFSIHRLDGTTAFPPTDSEAAAECGEYDRRGQRIRCRTQVRQWYRDLASMRATIDYYQGLLD